MMWYFPRQSLILALITGTTLTAIAVHQKQTAPHQTAANYRAEEQRKEIADERTADYTRWIAIFSGLLFGATAVLAVFTYGLWESTTEMVGKSDAANADNASKMERSIAQATRAATAMEGVASASAGNAEIARRAWAAANPPLLAFRGGYITTPKEGPPIIRFAIENTGHSKATITSAYLLDSLRKDGLPGAQAVYGGDNTMEGAELRPAIPVEFEYLCREISADHLGPAPTTDEMLRALIGEPLPGTGTYAPLTFWGSVQYVTEGDKPEKFYFSSTCTPPSRHFSTTGT